jgi:uncharacterized membrane protein
MSNQKLRILLAGESWMTYSAHTKGFASYNTGLYSEGVDPLRDAFEGLGYEFTYIRNHEATEKFPRTLEELQKFDLIIFSDLPADTLLLHNDTFVLGQRSPNRLRLVADYVKAGGGFLMVGGYMSFSGIEGKANYHFSPIAEILPVGMYGFDDRIESPEGVTPTIEQPDHPILAGIPGEWPFFLGYNKLKPGNDPILIKCQGDPFLAVRQYGQGRTAAFASDCSPHWAPVGFTSWEYYPVFWKQLATWLAGKSD